MTLNTPRKRAACLSMQPRNTRDLHGTGTNTLCSFSDYVCLWIMSVTNMPVVLLTYHWPYGREFDSHYNFKSHYLALFHIQRSQICKFPRFINTRSFSAERSIRSFLRSAFIFCQVDIFWKTSRPSIRILQYVSLHSRASMTRETFILSSICTKNNVASIELLYLPNSCIGECYIVSKRFSTEKESSAYPKQLRGHAYIHLLSISPST